MSASRRHHPSGQMREEDHRHPVAGTLLAVGTDDDAGTAAGGDTAAEQEAPTEVDGRYGRGTTDPDRRPQHAAEEGPTAGGAHRCRCPWRQRWRRCCPRNAGGRSRRPAPSSLAPWPSSSPSSCSGPGRRSPPCRCSARRSCSRRSRRSWPTTTTGAGPAPAGRTSGPCRRRRCRRCRHRRCSRASTRRRRRNAKAPDRLLQLHYRPPHRSRFRRHQLRLQWHRPRSC